MFSLKKVLNKIRIGFEALKKLIESNRKKIKVPSKIPKAKPILHIRGQDGSGSGAFGAPRKRKDGTSYKHQGIDIKSKPGQKIKALTSGKFLRKVDPYGDGKFSGFVIEDEKENVQKIFYVLPTIRVNNSFEKGDIIGTAQNISGNRDMVNHYHFEVRNKNKKLLNPNNYLKSKYTLV